MRRSIWVERAAVAERRPEVELLRENAALLNGTQPRADVAMFLPFRRWTVTEDCRAMQLAQALGVANVPFKVVSEVDMKAGLDPGKTKVLLIESSSVLTGTEPGLVDKFEAEGGKVFAADKPDWLVQLQKLIREPSVRVQGPPGIRAIVRDQPGRTIVYC